MNEIEEINKNEIAPTLTLAKLYESQNQLFDALAIYDYLMGISPRDDIRQNRETLLDKIFSEDKLKYHPLITDLFGQDELKYFNIIPKDKYQTYIQTYKSGTNLKFPDELEIEDDETHENEIIPNEELDAEVEIENLKKQVQAETQFTQKVTKIDANNDILETNIEKKMTVQDFTKKLIERFGAETRLDKISINDFFEIISDLR